MPVAVEPAYHSRLRTIGVWGNEQLSVTAGPLQVKNSQAFTLSGGAMFGVIPGVVLPRYDVTAMRTNFITTPAGSNYIIGSVVGIRWSYLGPVTRQSGTYSTELNGFRAGANLCSSLTYDSQGFVALLCSGFTVGLMHLETTDRASEYRQSKDVGVGAVSFELDARYNIGKFLHVRALAAGEFWMSRLTAERADSSELFHSRYLNASLQLGMGVHF